ncbi:MAG: glutamate-5-semialdehyde dehydrogenase [Solirubrobacteraceae bacterium]
MASAVTSVSDTCARARAAARTLATLPAHVKDAALEAIASALESRVEEILAANARDMQAGAEAEIGAALLDRLALDEGRVAAIAAAVRAVAALPDPVGEVLEGRTLGNGLALRKVRVPLGVVAVVYEARPNVTIDAAALCLKSGNAIVLRGSSTAAHSNVVLAGIGAEAAEAAGLPAGSVSLVAGGGRAELAELATQTDSVDLIVPRGGEGLKRALSEVATVPVIYAASGNCHVYVDAAADAEMARRIVLNAKVQRPGVCNAAETLLVHEAIAQRALPQLARELVDAGVQLRVDERAAAILDPVELPGAADGQPAVAAASEVDWETEYLALTLAVRVVDSLEQAVEHIARHGSGHSEAIVTGDLAAARAFQLHVDAACVYVNASTRFTDGGELGMGAEIGNSTQKLHARGPIGLRELCAEKYLIEGDGHVRE